MSDSYSNHQTPNRSNLPNQRDGGRNFRGTRGQGNRDAGGFRIRLSDNEIRAARSLQEAFNLRSTVAVLGFAVRTLAQLLEEGKLEDFSNEFNSQANAKVRENDNQRMSGGFDQKSKGNKNFDSNKPNPFARPEKPQSKESEIDTETEKESQEGPTNSKEEQKSR